MGGAHQSNCYENGHPSYSTDVGADCVCNLPRTTLDGCSEKWSTSQLPDLHALNLTLTLTPNTSTQQPHIVILIPALVCTHAPHSYIPHSCTYHHPFHHTLTSPSHFTNPAHTSPHPHTPLTLTPHSPPHLTHSVEEHIWRAHVPDRALLGTAGHGDTLIGHIWAGSIPNDIVPVRVVLHTTA